MSFTVLCFLNIYEYVFEYGSVSCCGWYYSVICRSVILVVICLCVLYICIYFNLLSAHAVYNSVVVIRECKLGVYFSNPGLQV